MQVKKRDGSLVLYNPAKIETAIFKAMRSVGIDDKKKAGKITEFVDAELQKNYFSIDAVPSIEDIQDIVERQLMLHKFPDVAKAYILYRDLHNRMRNINNLMDVSSVINGYIQKSDWKIHADDQIDYSLQGMYKMITNYASEQFWFNEVYTREMRDCHEEGDFHIHKSSSLSSYCVGWDLYDILVVGFGGVPGNVSSRPAKHLRSALGQLVNFLFTLTQETPDGAVAISSFDTYLAPFIRHDGLNYKEVKQALQEFVYNMNVPTKMGGQAVFSNITLDLECPEYLKETPIVIGGENQKEKYGDFQEEMDMFNKALTEIYVEGDAKGRVFTWPIPTYNITKNFNWNNKNLDGLWEMTAKYGIPFFANFINSDMNPDDARSMCCRLRIDKRQLQKRGGGYFGANPLTGSIGYVTINLPRLGYKYKGNKEEYFNALSRLMDISKDVLISRRKFIENMTENGLYPYCKFYLRSVKEKSGKYWSNHFSTIGLVGMNESCLNFMDKDITTEEGNKFAGEVLDFMNKKLLEYQEESDILYNLEASPAEGACYRLAKMDKKKYPDIIVANESKVIKGAEPFYTNSTQLPVDYKGDVFSALDLQDHLQTKYTGGTVFHTFLGERLNNGEQAKQLVKKIAENYKLPYFTLTPTFSICEKHGYISGEHETCSKCGDPCKIYSRIVGKISPTSRWNPGKKAEFKIREEFKVDNSQL